MKTSKLLLSSMLTATVFFTSQAYAKFTQEDAQTMHEQTKKERKVQYICQGKQKVTVTYGFNQQNLPTFAQANVNGKLRFMPINLYRSDNTGTVFGDENNFSLMASGDALTLKNYKKLPMMIQTPASEIVYKNCKAK
ncbi:MULTISPECIES: DUF7606 domain-containing protein [Rodentibacter]|uniref:ACP-like domain-containing protein n=1 Tax=Rodentibacter TaxID=1960084 RepID=UPI001CFE5153|nr:adhesin [Rodentibacter sp. JRC1]GJI54997.1 hypothetical protein HEMROJRC1_01090 [Rodentibacter sp. JRC1]